MTQKEKAEMLKDTIIQLYAKEGRSKSYISNLLSIDRKTLIYKINEWKLIKADKRHFTPSNQKFLNKNKKIIIDMLDSDCTIKEISQKIGKTSDSLIRTFIKNDKELLHHYNMYIARQKQKAQQRIEHLQGCSSRQYNFPIIPNEQWKEILGYDGYYVSNMGRVKKKAKRYNSFYLLSITYNSISGYGYVSVVNNNGKPKNLSVARLVGHNFVDDYGDSKNTIDHIDGNNQNNCAANLEWVSQSENNLRAYKNGKNTHKGYSKRGKFKKIILDNTYEFKTIVALAKFLQVSETQVARYIDGKCKTSHKFQFIY